MLPFAIVAANMCGCNFTQNARLFDMQTARTSRVVLEHADLRWGEIRGTAPDGGQCEGTFSAVSADNAREMLGPDILISDNANASLGLLRCAGGTVLRCTMVGRPGAGFSYGACTDARGHEYDLLVE